DHHGGCAYRRSRYGRRDASLRRHGRAGSSEPFVLPFKWTGHASMRARIFVNFYAYLSSITFSSCRKEAPEDRAASRRNRSPEGPAILLEARPAEASPARPQARLMTAPVAAPSGRLPPA